MKREIAQVLAYIPFEDTLWHCVRPEGRRFCLQSLLTLASLQYDTGYFLCTNLLKIPRCTLYYLLPARDIMVGGSRFYQYCIFILANKLQLVFSIVNIYSRRYYNFCTITILFY